MSKLANRSDRGFTLIELAIVLAIAGLLFVGLWRLMSGANTQVRDEAAANQQLQLISAIKGYLATTPGGTGFMTANPGCPGGGGVCPVGASFALPLPTTYPETAASCVADLTAAGDAGLCYFLPTGFTGAASATPTTNAYGQAYNVRVWRDSVTPAGTAPVTYSFMIITSGGSTIPDTSGGRISALIGGDGGFIYTNLVCGAVATKAACGAYGAWMVADVTTASPAGYSFPTSASGTVSTRTFVSPNQNSQDYWLARVLMPGETVATPPPIHNTMQTDLFLGTGTNTGVDHTFPDNPGSNNFWLGNSNSQKDYATGGNMYIQGGSIAAQEQTPNFAINFATSFVCGVVDGTPGDPLNGSCTPPVGSAGFSGPIGGTGSFTGNYLNKAPGYAFNPFINVSTGCTVDETAADNAHLVYDPTNCVAGLQVDGDATFSGQVRVDSLYATTFVYSPCVGPTCSSDVRLKSNIHPINNALDDLMKLRPVSYVLNTTGQASLGVIAQDVQKVYPQLVVKMGDINGVKDSLGVNYNGLIGPLIGAVQELKKENDELRQEISAQAVRQKKMEQEIEARPAGE